MHINRKQNGRFQELEKERNGELLNNGYKISGTIKKFWKWILMMVCCTALQMYLMPLNFTFKMVKMANSMMYILPQKKFSKVMIKVIGST